MLLLWGAINTPLVYVGSYFGFKTTPPETPVRTNKIPRQVPPQPWYMSPWFSALVGGVLPFGAVFIELFFILTSMWLHQTYYIFGILFLVYVILVLTCAEITIVLCYFQLCGEDYRWWWRSFFTSGSSALYGEFIYFWLFLVIFGYFWLFWLLRMGNCTDVVFCFAVFLYSAFYFATKLDITRTVPTIMYFCYMGLLSLGFLMITGTVGFVSCLGFVRAIYGSVKID